MVKLLSKMMLLGVLLFPTYTLSQTLNIGSLDAVGDVVGTGQLAVVGVEYFPQGGGVFSDRYNFSVGPAVSAVKIEVLDTLHLNDVGITGSNLRLKIDGSPNPILADDIIPIGDFLVIDGLASGNYQFRLVGELLTGFVGDYAVRVTAVPLPAAFWMFGSALVALFAFARRRNYRESYA